MKISRKRLKEIVEEEMREGRVITPGVANDLTTQMNNLAGALQKFDPSALQGQPASDLRAAWVALESSMGDVFGDGLENAAVPTRKPLEECGMTDEPLPMPGPPPEPNRALEPVYDDDEGQMAMGQLSRLVNDAGELTNLLGGQTQLPSWVQAKVTKATDYISAVKNYLQYQQQAPQGLHEMKISKQRLAEIVQEEYNTTLKEAEFVGHHADIDGKTYVDSNFLNSVKRIRDTFPHELKSMGFGEFYLETPEGKVQFDRSRGQSVQGTVADFVGRAHQLYGEPPELADKLMAAMEAAGASEAVSIVGVGGSDSEGYSKAAGTRPMEEEEKPTFAGHEDQFMEKVKQLIAADEMKVEIGDDFEETMIHFIQQDRTPQEAADRYIGLHDEGPAGYSSFNESTPEEYKMKISRERLMEIIKEEMQLEAGGDPVGPVEAKKMAELLQNLGFTLTRGGENSLIDFLQGLEGQGDLSATPDSRRGAIAEESEEAPLVDREGAVLKELGLFLAKLANEGHDELASELDKILVKLPEEWRSPSRGLEEAGRPHSMRGGRTMADLDKDAKTRETDFLKKKEEEEEEKT